MNKFFRFLHLTRPSLPGKNALIHFSQFPSNKLLQNNRLKSSFFMNSDYQHLGLHVIHRKEYDLCDTLQEV
jgi:hypothetical protein